MHSRRRSLPTALTKLDPSAPECSAAAKWIASHVQTSEQGKLASCIAEVLAERYSGHWYPDEPHRGSGFRAISCSVHGLDQLLVKAAQRAKQDPKKLLDILVNRGVQTVWVNPGEVKAQNGKNLLRIFSDGAHADNPYEKPRLKMPERVRTPSPTESTGSNSSASSTSRPTGAVPVLVQPPGLPSLQVGA